MTSNLAFQSFGTHSEISFIQIFLWKFYLPLFTTLLGQKYYFTVNFFLWIQFFSWKWTKKKYPRGFTLLTVVSSHWGRSRAWIDYLAENWGKVFSIFVWSSKNVWIWGSLIVLGDRVYRLKKWGRMCEARTERGVTIDRSGCLLG